MSNLTYTRCLRVFASVDDLNWHDRFKTPCVTPVPIDFNVMNRQEINDLRNMLYEAHALQEMHKKTISDLQTALLASKQQLSDLRSQLQNKEIFKIDPRPEHPHGKLIDCPAFLLTDDPFNGRVKVFFYHYDVTAAAVQELFSSNLRILKISAARFRVYTEYYSPNYPNSTDIYTKCGEFSDVVLKVTDEWIHIKEENIDKFWDILCVQRKWI